MLLHKLQKSDGEFLPESHNHCSCLLV